MGTARGWIGRALAASALVMLACISCSSSDEDPLVTREIARQDVGPAGGTVTGGGVTIEIPEGALTETKTIIINEAVDPTARKVPADTQIAGGLYLLQPDDVTFLKPVTVTVRVDESKKRGDGKGALMLFRGTGGSAWTPYGADETTATVVVGKTTHFSLWAPTAAAETYCYLNQCHGFALAAPSEDGKTTGAETLPGLDCKVPNVGEKGVVCKGTAPDKGPPYECHCEGSDVTLGTWARLPPDTAVTAMAQQCGAPACPPKPTFDCDLGLSCSDSANGWTCSTLREPRVLCNGGASGASCSCTTGEPFTLPNTNKLTNDDLVAPWQASCGGSCENAGTDPNTEFVCPGTLGYLDPAGQCIVETAGTCRDNHVYRAECEPGDGKVVSCKCMVDGAVTKTVKAACPAAGFVCGFPRGQGESTTQQCPFVLTGPLKEGATPQDPPTGCLAQPAGTCRDGHTYSAECQGYESEVSSCTCKEDGVVKKTLNMKCVDAPTECGWPTSK
ncbi:MAG: hypothetical protein KF764_11975 [Labilithrix sp.]|nr:hypothetical protein [Labilithrix sp.]MBX3223110.1 hypothetical protein [Labilithrix sp.]